MLRAVFEGQICPIELLIHVHAAGLHPDLMLFRFCKFMGTCFVVFSVASFSAALSHKPPNTNKHIHILIFFDSATQFLKVRDSSLGAIFGSTTTHHEATSGLVRTELCIKAFISAIFVGLG